MENFYRMSNPVDAMTGQVLHPNARPALKGVPKYPVRLFDDETRKNMNAFLDATDFKRMNKPKLRTSNILKR